MNSGERIPLTITVAEILSEAQTRRLRAHADAYAHDEEIICALCTERIFGEPHTLLVGNMPEVVCGRCDSLEENR